MQSNKIRLFFNIIFLSGLLLHNNATNSVDAINQYSDDLKGEASLETLLSNLKNPNIGLSETTGKYFSTYYIGGSVGYSVTVDSQNNIIVTGKTYSSTYPILNGFDDTLNGTSDAFVAKFDSSGERIWSTYLGGNNHDKGYY